MALQQDVQKHLMKLQNEQNICCLENIAFLKSLINYYVICFYFYHYQWLLQYFLLTFIVPFFFSILIHFMPLVSFYIPWKHIKDHKFFWYLQFGIESNQWQGIGSSQLDLHQSVWHIYIYIYIHSFNNQCIFWRFCRFWYFAVQVKGI